MKIDKESFISTAMNLDGSYYDYGRCLYSMSLQNNILEQVNDYMINYAKDVNDLDWFVYDLLGRPEPYIVVDSTKHLVAA